ncbi:hypothetical protein BJY04DRAFT_178551 [Aspergillus karnatakaensis]|uniref:uncharacterized protein n=1 Tax=Aspergillus karnatakaensis TaxID=1810916 RepID=UPI003CCDAE34
MTILFPITILFPTALLFLITLLLPVSNTLPTRVRILCLGLDLIKDPLHNDRSKPRTSSNRQVLQHQRIIGNASGIRIIRDLSNEIPIQRSIALQLRRRLLTILLTMRAPVIHDFVPVPRQPKRIDLISTVKQRLGDCCIPMDNPFKAAILCETIKRETSNIVGVRTNWRLARCSAGKWMTATSRNSLRSIVSPESQSSLSFSFSCPFSFSPASSSLLSSSTSPGITPILAARGCISRKIGSWT